jgi:HSP20 family protein
MIQVKHAPINKNLNVVLDEFFNALPSTWGRDGRSDTPTAPANISETAEGYHLELLVPGRNKEDFQVSIDKGLLTVSFDKKEEETIKETKHIRREFRLNNFKRTFNLDEKINSEAIEAKYENGILKFYLPKKEEVKIAPKAITIQ